MVQLTMWGLAAAMALVIPYPALAQPTSEGGSSTTATEAHSASGDHAWLPDLGVGATAGGTSTANPPWSDPDPSPVITPGKHCPKTPAGGGQGPKQAQPGEPAPTTCTF